MLNVLIIEDDRDIAELQAVCLRDRVNSVQLVTDSFDRCFYPDLWQGVTTAVIDLMLPDVDGEDICRFLQSQFPLIRRIICTAKPIEQVIKLGDLADAVLLKPFVADDLVKAVKHP